MTLRDLHLAPGDALFLDFDGTLVEIGPDPDAIQLAPAAAQALARIVPFLGGAVALLSGRDLRDLALRTPDTVWRAGGHGLEILAPGAPPPTAPPPPPQAVLDALKTALTLPGVRLELKGPVAAIHYRAAPDAEAAVIAAAVEAARTVPGYVHQAGKMVVEVKPATAHKGAALRRIAASAPFHGRRPLMLGDDTTDEDAIIAAQDLGGIGIKIGPGPSAARLRAPNPAAVRSWLARQPATG